MSERRKPLIILTGPTAVGKTESSILLAKRIGGEIISADSMQVYKYMDIGSAKITEAEMDGVPHFMIDELEPFDKFNVTLFKQLAVKYMNDIYGRGHIPILTGGTGFYLQAVLYDIDFTENKENSLVRAELENFYKENGAAALHNRLKLIDEKSAEAIHENNVKRVIRAIEFYELTGNKISEHNERERQKKSPYNFCYFVLTDERKNLYEKIDRRVDLMIEKGLVDEVLSLKKMGCSRELVSMQGLGYKEILDYLDGNCTLDEAVYIIKRDTRHFAKRQLTWFGRERDVIYIPKHEFNYDNNQILDFMLRNIYERGLK